MLISAPASAASLLGLLLLLLLRPSAHAWKTHTIEDYGAVPNTDATTALRAALAAAHEEGGGEVLVPNKGEYLTAPINVTSNVVLRVDGRLFGVRDESAYPIVDLLPSYDGGLDEGGGLVRNHRRHHPLIWSVNATNVTICGSGLIDGAGSYWLEKYHNQSLRAGRPHLMEILGGSDITINGGLTLQNSGFWTLHPTYCENVHIHNIQIVATSCEVWSDKCNPNIDGIDVDSSHNVLIENNYISVGDDHVTVLSGRGAAGRAYGRSSRNVTVRNNILGTGMGLSIGSSVSGGVEDVLYYNNTMSETREQWGQGVHVKTRIGIGGFIRNVVWDSNEFRSTGTEAIIIEADYQSGGTCGPDNCTRIDGIVLRNLVFRNSSSPGRIVCSKVQPCRNITFDNVQINGTVADEWGKCQGVVSSTFTDLQPPGLEELCGASKPDSPEEPRKESEPAQNKAYMIVYILSAVVTVVVIAELVYHRGAIKTAFRLLRRRCCGTPSSVREPLLDKTIVFETADTDTLVV